MWWLQACYYRTLLSHHSNLLCKFANPCATDFAQSAYNARKALGLVGASESGHCFCKIKHGIVEIYKFMLKIHIDIG